MTKLLHHAVGYADASDAGALFPEIGQGVDLMRGREFKVINRDEQIEKLKQLGVQVTYPDKAGFKALMKPAYTRMAASGHIS